MFPKYYRGGAYTAVYKTKDKMFKEFDSRSEAIEAWQYQDILSGFNLAPEVRSNVKRIRVHNYSDSKSKYRISAWGYYTEIAKTLNNHPQPCECMFCERVEEKYIMEIEQLCDHIEAVLGRAFIDCHIGNVGWIIRNGQKVLVCIDTGIQSFSGYSDYEEEYA